MSLKKMFPLAVVCACFILTFTGCSMCSIPIPNDPSCIESTHITDKSVNPSVLAFTAPTIAPCKDVFRPSFIAGTKRITVTGSGDSLEEATADAVEKFLTTAKCDYIVAVARVISMKTHPTWRFFATTNYTVTFSGLPVYLDKLIKEEPKPPREPKKILTKAEIIEIVNITIKNYINNYVNFNNPLGLLKLTDLNVVIQAKGETQNKLGVVFPAK